MSKSNDELEEALALNINIKQQLVSGALSNLSLCRAKLCLEDENKMITAEIQVLKQEIEYLNKENSGWFKEYQESVESLEEVFGKRKIYIEGIYRDLFKRLEELKMREILLDQQILQLEREKSQIAEKGLAIMYKTQISKNSKQGVLEILTASLLIFLAFYMILL